MDDKPKIDDATAPGWAVHAEDLDGEVTIILTSSKSKAYRLAQRFAWSGRVATVSNGVTEDVLHPLRRFEDQEKA